MVVINPGCAVCVSVVVGPRWSGDKGLSRREGGRVRVAARVSGAWKELAGPGR